MFDKHKFSMFDYFVISIILNQSFLFSASHSKSSFDVIICKSAEGDLTKLYGILLNFLKPQGCLVATVPASGAEPQKELLKLSGFVKIDETSEGNFNHSFIV